MFTSRDPAEDRHGQDEHRRHVPEQDDPGLRRLGGSAPAGIGIGPADDIAVCVPVRNEAACLPALLDALDRQQAPGGAFTACFFFDGCADGSADLVRARAEAPRFAVRLAEGGGGAPNAGRARAAALAMGLAALGGTDGILLTTDADGMPADDWIARSRAALDVADVVAGRIARQPYPPSPVQDRLEAYYDRLHAFRRQLDPVPWEAPATHHYTGGANLGFRASAYRALGGFLPLPAGEDARIVDDAGRLGLRVRRDAASVVHTSPRRQGRAAGGLADMLRQLDIGDAPPRVGHPADAAWQYRAQARARLAYADGRPGGVAGLLGLTPDHCIGVARDCGNAEAFAMRIVPAPPGGGRQLGLDAAEAVLAELLGVFA